MSGQHHSHPDPLILAGGVALYLAVGISAGALASRLAYKYARRSKATNAQMWGWWTTFTWPFVGIGWLLFGFGYGAYRILNRIIIPAEVRK